MWALENLCKAVGKLKYNTWIEFQNVLSDRLPQSCLQGFLDCGQEGLELGHRPTSMSITEIKACCYLKHGSSQVLCHVVLMAEARPNRAVAEFTRVQSYFWVYSWEYGFQLSWITAEQSLPSQNDPLWSWASLHFQSSTWITNLPQMHFCLWITSILKLLRRDMSNMPSCWHHLICRFQLLLVFSSTKVNAWSWFVWRLNTYFLVSLNIFPQQFDTLVIDMSYKCMVTIK